MSYALALGLRRVKIELLQFFRDRESAVFTFILPLMLLMIFGTVFNQEISPGVTFSQYFVAGMIASGVVYTGFQNLAITIPQEREDGTLKRLQGTPMPKSSYFIGKIGLVLVSCTAQITLLAVIGAAFFHLKLPSDASSWATFLWVNALGLVCCTLLGIAFSSVPKTGKGAPAMVTPIVLVLQFTSGVFFMFQQLPSWMQTAASFFPLKWLVQGSQSVFLPADFSQAAVGTDTWELGKVALVLIAWTVGALIVALLTFRWQRRGAA